MMLRDRLRSNRPICRIDVSAFVSVLTALLFLFMVYRVFTYSPEGGHRSTLPRAVNSRELAQANREDALIVAVFHDGRIFFDTGQVMPDDLPAKLREKVRAGAPPIVFISVDSRARYREVATVLDSIRSSGLVHVAFMTQKPRLAADEEFSWDPVE